MALLDQPSEGGRHRTQSKPILWAPQSCKTINPRAETCRSRVPFLRNTLQHNCKHDRAVQHRVLANPNPTSHRDTPFASQARILQVVFDRLACRSLLGPASELRGGGGWRGGGDIGHIGAGCTRRVARHELVCTAALRGLSLGPKQRIFTMVSSFNPRIGELAKIMQLFAL